MIRRSSACTGALVAFVLAEGVAAHPRPTNALDQVRLIGAADPQADEDAYARGKRLLAADDATGALAAFREALSVAPDSVDAMNGIGVAYDRLGRGDLAQRFYRAGLARAPGSAALNNNLGYSLYLSGDLAGAVGPLRAAAASDDAGAAAAARATLARLVVEVRSDARSEAPAAVARIEVTNDGEQRLTFAPPPAAAAALGDAADTVAVADAWTAQDDAALVAEVRRDEAVDAAAAMVLAAANAPVAAPVELALSAPAETAAPTSPPAAAPTPVPARRAAEATPSASSFVLTAARDATPARRLRSSAAPAAIAASSGPQPRATIAFDSDDDELNAFAARVRSRAVAEREAHAAAPRIAERFRA
ncbi:MAG: hypothetical protein JO290_10580 [Sphingomonadaceae bacterium]|nr:hypothetical protein [Sphingomonadaceae bacterium]